MSDDFDEPNEAMKRQRGNVDKQTANVEAMRKELQERFKKLDLSNEATRKLSEEIARLVEETSQRMPHLESKS